MGASASMTACMPWPESETEFDLSEYEDDYYNEQEYEYIENNEDDEEENRHEELENRREDAFKYLNTAIEKINKIHRQKDINIQWKVELNESLRSIMKVYIDIGNIYNPHYDVVQKYRRKAGKKMFEAKTTTVILAVVMDCWSSYQADANENETIQLLNTAISVLWNFSDSTLEVSRAIIKEKGFLETLKKILTSYQDLSNTEEDRKIDYMTKGALSIVNNVSQVDESIPRMRSLEIATTINPYLDEDDMEVRLITLSALANIVDEKQCEVLKDRHDVIKLLLITLESALKNDDHRCNGFSPRECGLTIRRLATSDANKKLLVDMGCLDQLVKLAKCATVEEQREAVGAIRVLAFDKDNQRKILESSELQIIELLDSLKKQSSGDEKVKEDADCILWILRKRLEKNANYKQIANSYIKEVFTEKKGHVMISYNWCHQKQLKKICNALQKKDFPVWMDTKNMRGPKYQDMAEAVENASVVILCYSRKYKGGPNCRMEAEYASDLGKPTIALKMEGRYKPDGWLAILIAGKIFIDFSGKYSFDKKMKELTRQLASSFESKPIIKNPSTRKQAEDFTDGGSAPTQRVASVRKWTSTDVDNWIDRNKLPRSEFGGMTGRDLAGLFMMKLEAPECFYGRLKTDLKIESFATIDMLIVALDEFTD